MDPVLKEKWLKALRSGDYKQGRCWLRGREDRFCCLGVLCEVAGLKATNNGFEYFYEDSSAYLPESVKLRANFPNKYWDALNTTESYLVNMNDLGATG